jgi:glycosyltransferase involved in cell wall biosynthesis
MNALHVTPGYYPAYIYGGPIESVHQLCRHLGRAGCGVKVLTTDANGPQSVLKVDTNHVVHLEENLDVRYCRRIWPHTISPALLGMLSSCVREADVVHLTSVYSFPTLPTLAICKRLQKPVVWSPRGSFQRWQGTRRPRLKALWGLVCRQLMPDKLVIHVTSEQEAQEAASHMGNIDIAVIPNGVLLPETIVHSPRERDLRLLYVGRLHRRKGIEELLQACRILLDRKTTAWNLTIAGSGDEDYVRALKALTASLSLKDRVTFAGMLVGPDKETLFQHADILVQPSYSENFGLVVAEALAHGIPVIAGIGTPWSRLEAHGCGLWVPNSPESLAAAIARLERLPLREWGERGRLWMSKEFEWQSLATRMLALYRGLTTGSRHGLPQAA